jgi:hypothetical protein
VAVALIASLVLASSAFAASAGEEYLPKLPTAGASSVEGVYGIDKSALPSRLSGASSARRGGQTLRAAASSGQQAGDEQQQQQAQDEKKGKASKRAESVALTSDQDGTGGDGSGSILLSPLVLLMISAVIAAAVAMTLSRRRGADPEREGEHPLQEPRRETTGPRTPDGEIVAGPDQVT